MFFFVLIRFSKAASDGYHDNATDICDSECIRQKIQVAGRQYKQYWLESVERTSRARSSPLTNNDGNGRVNPEILPGLILVVGKNGPADFQRIQEAVDFVPENNTRRVVIYIRAGVYREKVTIPWNKPFITFQGEGRKSTVIKWHDKGYSVQRISSLNMGTYLSASVAVNADFFVAADISFKNTARFCEKDKYKQAVALRVSADRAIFLNCGFYGHQDTLYDHQGRHYFLNCTIMGSVDFIFGNGRSLYENCHVHALGKGGAVTAQHRKEATELTGFAYVRCKFTGDGRPYLGRAWGDFSRVVYVKSELDSALDPQGFSDFGHPDRKRTAFFGIYDCKGSGAVTAMESGWTKQLTFEEARPFLDRSFINASYWLDPYFAV
ncbi:hypothetical protein SUGI_0436650 [Cryptomeria japonica]|nr:hypothetical protein SUGI_0436650 [Cryptomeria japonica]